ncbi:Gfo/Idh/MocA family protein [Lentzea sp. NPDC059081]|uniref:Gfo/Idh/MocA family protein n=1 Tax=Lentzea sp. NPDC059081 TaxID=3346719 RepID=UPI0036C71B0F
MRIGIIGSENSHVGHIVEHLKDGPDRVVAVVDAPEDLFGLVDAVVVAHRHGDLHRPHAIPFLREGLPVFVDKPLAVTNEDAEAIVAEALAHHAPLTSFSALRWLPGTDALAAAGTPLRVTASGPVDPASPYGGIFFYGIHPVDVALRLAPGPIESVDVTTHDDRIAVLARVGGVEVEIDLVLGEAPFRGSVTTSAGTTERELVLDEHYFVPGLEKFLEMTATGKPPVGYDDLLRPVHLLNAVAKAIA